MRVHKLSQMQVEPQGGVILRGQGQTVSSCQEGGIQMVLIHIPGPGHSPVDPKLDPVHSDE